MVCFILVLGIIECVLDDSGVNLYVVNDYCVLSLHYCSNKDNNEINH